MLSVSMSAHALHIRTVISKWCYYYYDYYFVHVRNGEEEEP